MKNTGYQLCNGCGVCTVSCPLWRETKDMTITAGGRAMAMKGGASGPELLPLLKDCVLCGACGAVCPMGVDTIGIAMGIRTGLDVGELKRSMPSKGSAQGYYFMPGKALRGNKALLEKSLALLNSGGKGYSLTSDDADALVAALDGRGALSLGEAAQYLKPFRESAAKLVITEGMLHRLFRDVLGEGIVVGLGEALTGIARVQKGLNSTDLYIIDGRAFHSDFARLIGYYDGMRRKVGMMMNFDLQRSASTTGATCGGCGDGNLGVNPEVQARWILEGRSVERVVVERVEDIAPFKAATNAPVVHLCQVAD